MANAVFQVGNIGCNCAKVPEGEIHCLRACVPACSWLCVCVLKEPGHISQPSVKGWTRSRKPSQRESQTGLLSLRRVLINNVRGKTVVGSMFKGCNIHPTTSQGWRAAWVKSDKAEPQRGQRPHLRAAEAGRPICNVHPPSDGFHLGADKFTLMSSLLFHPLILPL